MARVLLENLSKAYADKGGAVVPAVRGVSLDVADGEFMVVVGPSGCGKSSVLRLIAGLEEITAGQVSIDGRRVNGVPPKDRDVAMVFQNYALYPHLTVRENLGFGLRMRGASRAEIEARVREAAAQLGLEQCLERRPKALSGGQRQRVALGRAIVRRPKAFLFDEPLSNLDAQMRVAMRAELARLHARLGATMIYVTHDQVEAMTLGDRVCVMRAGEVQQVAEPLELYRRPANLFVAGFIGSPPMNFLRGSVTAEGGTASFAPEGGAPALPLSAALAAKAPPGRPVVLGVRPEDLRVSPPGTGALGATVELVEPTGAETHLYLRSAAGSLAARARADGGFATGAEVAVGFDWDNAHLFDAQSEKRL